VAIRVILADATRLLMNTLYPALLKLCTERGLKAELVRVARAENVTVSELARQ
jgi:hypothetical protein